MRLCLKDSGILMQAHESDVVRCVVCGHKYTGEMLARIPMREWDEIRNTRTTMIGDVKVTLDPKSMVFSQEKREPARPRSENL